MASNRLWADPQSRTHSPAPRPSTDTTEDTEKERQRSQEQQEHHHPHQHQHQHHDLQPQASSQDGSPLSLVDSKPKATSREIFSGHDNDQPALSARPPPTALTSATTSSSRYNSYHQSSQQQLQQQQQQQQPGFLSSSSSPSPLQPYPFGYYHQPSPSAMAAASTILGSQWSGNGQATQQPSAAHYFSLLPEPTATTVEKPSYNNNTISTNTLDVARPRRGSYSANTSPTHSPGGTIGRQSLSGYVYGYAGQPPMSQQAFEEYLRPLRQSVSMANLQEAGGGDGGEGRQSRRSTTDKHSAGTRTSSASSGNQRSKHWMMMTPMGTGSSSKAASLRGEQIHPLHDLAQHDDPGADHAFHRQDTAQSIQTAQSIRTTHTVPSIRVSTDHGHSTPHQQPHSISFSSSMVDPRTLRPPGVSFTRSRRPSIDTASSTNSVPLPPPPPRPLNRYHRVLNTFTNRFVKRQLKFMLAFYLSSLFSLVRYFSPILGNSTHLSLLAIVFVQPARTIGAQLEATMFAMIGGLMTVIWVIPAQLIVVAFNQAYLGAPHYNTSVWAISACLYFIGEWCMASAKFAYAKLHCSFVIFTIICSFSFTNNQDITEFNIHYLGDLLAPMMIGVAVALFVNLVLWPESASEGLGRAFNESLDSSRTLLNLSTRSFLLNHQTIALPKSAMAKAQGEVRTAQKKLQAAYREARFEVTYSHVNPADYKEVRVIVSAMMRHLASMSLVVQNERLLMLGQPGEEFDSLVDEDEEYMSDEDVDDSVSSCSAGDSDCSLNTSSGSDSEMSKPRVNQDKRSSPIGQKRTTSRLSSQMSSQRTSRAPSLHQGHNPHHTLPEFGLQPGGYFRQSLSGRSSFERALDGSGRQFVESPIHDPFSDSPFERQSPSSMAGTPTGSGQYKKSSSAELRRIRHLIQRAEMSADEILKAREKHQQQVAAQQQQLQEQQNMQEHHHRHHHHKHHRHPQIETAPATPRGGLPAHGMDGPETTTWPEGEEYDDHQDHAEGQRQQSPPVEQVDPASISIPVTASRQNSIHETENSRTVQSLKSLLLSIGLFRGGQDRDTNPAEKGRVRSPLGGGSPTRGFSDDEAGESSVMKKSRRVFGRGSRKRQEKKKEKRELGQNGDENFDNQDSDEDRDDRLHDVDSATTESDEYDDDGDSSSKNSSDARRERKIAKKKAKKLERKAKKEARKTALAAQKAAAKAKINAPTKEVAFGDRRLFMSFLDIVRDPIQRLSDSCGNVMVAMERELVQGLNVEADREERIRHRNAQKAREAQAAAQAQAAQTVAQQGATSNASTLINGAAAGGGGVLARKNTNTAASPTTPTSEKLDGNRQASSEGLPLPVSTAMGKKRGSHWRRFLIASGLRTPSSFRKKDMEQRATNQSLSATTSTAEDKPNETPQPAAATPIAPCADVDPGEAEEEFILPPNMTYVQYMRQEILAFDRAEAEGLQRFISDHPALDAGPREEIFLIFFFLFALREIARELLKLGLHVQALEAPCHGKHAGSTDSGGKQDQQTRTSTSTDATGISHICVEARFYHERKQIWWPKVVGNFWAWFAWGGYSQIKTTEGTSALVMNSPDDLKMKPVRTVQEQTVIEAKKVAAKREEQAKEQAKERKRTRLENAIWKTRPPLRRAFSHVAGPGNTLLSMNAGGMPSSSGSSRGRMANFFKGRRGDLDAFQLDQEVKDDEESEFEQNFLRLPVQVNELRRNREIARAQFERSEVSTRKNSVTVAQLAQDHLKMTAQPGSHSRTSSISAEILVSRRNSDDIHRLVDTLDLELPPIHDHQSHRHRHHDKAVNDVLNPSKATEATGDIAKNQDDGSSRLEGKGIETKQESLYRFSVDSIPTYDQVQSRRLLGIVVDSGTSTPTPSKPAERIKENGELEPVDGVDQDDHGHRGSILRRRRGGRALGVDGSDADDSKLPGSRNISAAMRIDTTSAAVHEPTEPIPKPQVERPQTIFVQKKRVMTWRYWLWEKLQIFKTNSCRFGFKMALALTLLGLFSWLHFGGPTERGQWAMLTVMSVLSPTIGATFKVATLRILGTIIGILWALLNYLSDPMNPYVIAAFMFPLLFFCTYFMLGTGHPVLGTITLMSYTSITYIKYEDHTDETIYALCSKRAVMLILGIIVAMIINLLLWPIMARRVLRTEIASLIGRQGVLFAELVNKHLLQPPPPLSKFMAEPPTPAGVLATSTGYRHSNEQQDQQGGLLLQRLATRRRSSVVSDSDRFSTGSHGAGGQRIGAALGSTAKYDGPVSPSDVPINPGLPPPSPQRGVATYGAVSKSETHWDRTDPDRLAFQHVEQQLQNKLIKISSLLVLSELEPRLKEPFPTALYRQITECCQNILDRMISMRMAAQLMSPEVRELVTGPMNSYRREMVGALLLYFSVLSSSLASKSPLPPYLPSARMARLCVIYKVRDVIAAHQAKTGQDHYTYIYYYAFSSALEEVIEELELLAILIKPLVGVTMVTTTTAAQQYGLPQIHPQQPQMTPPQFIENYQQHQGQYPQYPDEGGSYHPGGYPPPPPPPAVGQYPDGWMMQGQQVQGYQGVQAQEETFLEATTGKEARQSNMDGQDVSGSSSESLSSSSHSSGSESFSGSEFESGSGSGSDGGGIRLRTDRENNFNSTQIPKPRPQGRRPSIYKTSPQQRSPRRKKSLSAVERPGMPSSSISRDSTLGTIYQNVEYTPPTSENFGKSTIPTSGSSPTTGAGSSPLSFGNDQGVQVKFKVLQQQSLPRKAEKQRRQSKFSLAPISTKPHPPKIKINTTLFQSGDATLSAPIVTGSGGKISSGPISAPLNNKSPQRVPSPGSPNVGPTSPLAFNNSNQMQQMDPRIMVRHGQRYQAAMDLADEVSKNSDFGMNPPIVQVPIQWDQQVDSRAAVAAAAAAAASVSRANNPVVKLTRVKTGSSKSSGGGGGGGGSAEPPRSPGGMAKSPTMKSKSKKQETRRMSVSSSESRKLEKSRSRSATRNRRSKSPPSPRPSLASVIDQPMAVEPYEVVDVKGKSKAGQEPQLSQQGQSLEKSMHHDHHHHHDYDHHAHHSHHHHTHQHPIINSGGDSATTPATMKEGSTSFPSRYSGLEPSLPPAILALAQKEKNEAAREGLDSPRSIMSPLFFTAEFIPVPPPPLRMVPSGSMDVDQSTLGMDAAAVLGGQQLSQHESDVTEEQEGAVRSRDHQHLN